MCVCAPFSLHLSLPLLPSIQFSSAAVLSSAAVWPGTIPSVPGRRESVSAVRRMAAAPAPGSRFALIGAPLKQEAGTASERCSRGRRRYRLHLASPRQKWNSEPAEPTGCSDRRAFNRKQINKKKYTRPRERANSGRRPCDGVLVALHQARNWSAVRRPAVARLTAAFRMGQIGREDGGRVRDEDERSESEQISIKKMESVRS